MSSKDKGGGMAFQQDLDDDERKLAETLYSWLESNPNARWKQSDIFPGLEKCSETELRDLVKPLLPKVRSNEPSRPGEAPTLTAAEHYESSDIQNLYWMDSSRVWRPYSNTFK